MNDEIPVWAEGTGTGDSFGAHLEIVIDAAQAGGWGIRAGAGAAADGVGRQRDGSHDVTGGGIRKYEQIVGRGSADGIPDISRLDH